MGTQGSGLGSRWEQGLVKLFVSGLWCLSVNVSAARVALASPWICGLAGSCWGPLLGLPQLPALRERDKDVARPTLTPYY